MGFRLGRGESSGPKELGERRKSGVNSLNHRSEWKWEVGGGGIEGYEDLVGSRVFALFPTGKEQG